MWFPKLKTDLRLLAIYVVCVAVILHCYPVAQLTWDSYYYLTKAHDYEPSLRPAGYPFFLMFLGYIRMSLPLIVVVQFSINFISNYLLLRLVDSIFCLKNWQYLILGAILMTEPVALYHSFNILSDVLFATLTTAYLSTLILFIRRRNIWFFAAHVFTIFASIEVKHMALFYPYFSFAIIILYHPKIKPILLYALVIFGINQLLYQLHIHENKIRYHVPVYSAFSGWTHTNNALYCISYINLPLDQIEDLEIRRMHRFMTTYMDTSGYKPHVVGSEFLWDTKSPMCYLRKKLQDSLHVGYFEAWYLLSPSFSKYGLYLQAHYPLAYLKGFMIPNIQTTLFNPHDGEMGDYFADPDTDPTVMSWYNKKPEEFHVTHQIYNKHINHWNLTYYHLRLFLFSISGVLFVFLFKKIKQQNALSFFIPSILFVLVFYGLTIYASWFIHRYLLPVIPIMAAVIFTMLLMLFKPKAPEREKLDEPVNPS